VAAQVKGQDVDLAHLGVAHQHADAAGREQEGNEEHDPHHDKTGHEFGQALPQGTVVVEVDEEEGQRDDHAQLGGDRRCAQHPR
jgi:hypothetical protein